MAVQPSIRPKSPEVPPECIHCYGSGCVYDALEDEAHECWMCLGTGRRMSKAERERIEAERELDTQWSALERMGL